MRAEIAMAQRTFPCTSCSAPIEVPDDYFRALIACPHCGLAHFRLTGKAALSGAAPSAASPLPGAASPTPTYPSAPYPGQAPFAGPSGVPYPQPMGPQPYPRQGAPYPAPFPGQPFRPQFGGYAPLPQKSNKGLFIGLGIAGGVILMVLVLAAIPLIAGSAGANSSEDWYQYTSTEGGFSAKFPKKPLEDSEVKQTGLGPRTMYRAMCVSGGVNYEVIYFDLGEGPEANFEFDANSGFAHAADGMKGRVVSTERITVCGVPAGKGVIENDNGYRGEMACLRVGNRVYIIACERALAFSTINFQVFLDTFSLGAGKGAGPTSQDQWWSLYKPGATWTIRTTNRLPGGQKHINCMRAEVKSVSAGGARVKFVMLDQDMKPMAGIPDTLTDVLPPQSSGEPDQKVLARGEETLGQWATKWVEIDQGRSRTKIWYSVEFGTHLLIKSETTGDQMRSTSELIAFERGK